MTQHISKGTLAALAVMLFGLSACLGNHEAKGKQVGKNLDNFESNVKKKVDQGKETAHNAKESVEKKSHELHEKSKEKAHELINKS